MARYVSSSRTLDWGEGRRERYIYYHYDSFEDIKPSSESKQAGKRLLNQTIRVEYDGDQSWFSLNKLWIYSGPGLLMSIGYLDPGNLESDLQAGYAARYELIWVIWWSTVVGWLIQCLCIRMGTVTGRHLAEICRCEFGKKTSMLLWLFTELAIVGSDIQEVIGSAIALKILFGWSIWIGCLITAVDTFTFMLTSRYGTRKLEFVFTIMITIMVGTFSVLISIVKPDTSMIFEGWVMPRCQVKNEPFAVAILGSMIMSHNLFLHTALVQSREIDRFKEGAIVEANFYFGIESAMSLLIAFYINTTIMTAFAKGSSLFLMQADVGLENAGTYLREQFGRATEIIWGVGLLAAGQSSTMTGTYAGQYVMHGFLDIQWTPWKRTLLTRLIALGPSLVFAIAFTNNMDKFSQILNVQQSVQLPFAIIPLLSLNCNKRIMGGFVLRGWKEAGMWLLSTLIVVINIYMIQQTVSSLFYKGTWEYIGTWTFMIVYLCLIAWIIFEGRIRLCWEKSDSKSPRRLLIESISYPNAWTEEVTSCSQSPAVAPRSNLENEEKSNVQNPENERTPLLKKTGSYEEKLFCRI